ARWFANEAERVYAVLAESQEQRQVRRLVEWLQGRGGKITTRELQRANSRRWRTSEDAEADLSALVEVGAGKWVEGDAPEGGGHRPRWFELTCPTHDTSDTRSDGYEIQAENTVPSNECRNPAERLSDEGPPEVMVF